MPVLSKWAVTGLTVTLLATGAGALAAAVVHTSLRLTNPVGYQHHPAADQLPPSPDGQDPSADFGLAFEDVSFPTENGLTLRGWLVSGKTDRRTLSASIGIVTVHGRGTDRRAFLPHLPMLYESGATTLLFDMREHGLSDGSEQGMSMGYREAEDIRAAVRYLKGTGIPRVVVLGMSLGAGSAILAAAADLTIDGVIAESPYSSMEDYIQQLSDQGGGLARVPGLRSQLDWWPGLVVGVTAWRIGVPRPTAPKDVVERVAPRPLVLMHGTADTAFVPEHSVRLFSRARFPKELWLAEGAEHARIYQAYPEQYREHVAAVLGAALQAPAGPR